MNISNLFRCRVEITGGNTHFIVPINWQATWRYGSNTFLSVNFHNPDVTLLDELIAALENDPPNIVTFTMEHGTRIASDPSTDSYNDLISVELTTVRDDRGTSSYSARVDGSITYTNPSPQSVTLPSGVYIRSGIGARSWRGAADFNIRPGDQVIIADIGTPITVGSIFYNINANNATMEISELINASSNNGDGGEEEEEDGEGEGGGGGVA